MRIMTRLNLLSMALVLVMTVSVLAVGSAVITGILFRGEELVLRLELANVRQEILHALNRSGVLAATHRAAELQAALRAKDNLSSARLFIVESPGDRVVFHPELPAGTTADYDFVKSMFRNREGVAEYVFNGSPSYAVYTTVHPLGWLIGLSISKSEVLGKRDEFLWAAGAITLAVLLLNALVVRVFGKQLLARIQLTLDCLERIKNGDLSARITSLPISDEIGWLQEGVNAMSERIEQRTAEQLAAEKALRENRELLRSVIDNSTAVIFLKDADGRYILANKAFADLFHVKPEDVPGRTDHDFLPKAQADYLRAFDQQVIASMGPVERQVTLTLSGRERTYISLKYPLLDSSGLPYAVCGIATDITARLEAESERQARLLAEEANKAKSDFLARMSHEIRTPLNAVLGMIELSLDSRVSQGQRDNLETAQRSAHHLLEIINDILDFSKIEAGRLKLEKVDFNLPELIRSCLDVHRVQAGNLDLKLLLELDENIPVWVKGDPLRLRQILYNLLGNALKFTIQGHVKVRARMDGCVRPAKDHPEGNAGQAEEVCLCIAVEDTGIGIPEDVLENIFSMFTQADVSTSRRFGGTGLGLAIARNLAELMDGTLSAESKPGRGSSFTLRVRLEKGISIVQTRTPAKTTDVASWPEKPPRVLLVEDNPENVLVGRAFLKRMGIMAKVAHNGYEALEFLKGEPFDVVLMDVEMPEMDGMEATRRLRAGEAGENRRGIRVVALTAHTQPEFQQRCLDSGMDGVLSKPVLFAELRQVLTEMHPPRKP